MGYWHIGNKDAAYSFPSFHEREIDTDICTDVCTISKCGYDSKVSPRVDNITRLSRVPLVDFAMSEVPFFERDYEIYPDLQMYPAFAGAVVPIYNLPELSTKDRLVLSRSTLANIFLGKIAYWNDSRIGADNNLNVTNALAMIHEKIHVVVRHDSSGISKIFSESLKSFDPATGIIYEHNSMFWQLRRVPFLSSGASDDSSYASTVGNTAYPSKPMWCDPYTDEIAVFTVSNCSGSTAQRSVSMQVIDPDYNVTQLTWFCDDSALDLEAAFRNQLGMAVIVHKDIRSSGSSGSWAFRVGFGDLRLASRNWYQPRVLSSTAHITVSTLQEGSFWNTHFDISDYHVTQEIQSIFLYKPQLISYSMIISYGSLTTAVIDSSSATDLSDAIFKAINGIVNGLLVGVAYVPHTLWTEYQLTFNSPQPSSALSLLSISAVFNETASIAGTTYLLGTNAAMFVAVTSLLKYDNFPRFPDDSYNGVPGGRWTCYKRSLNYEPFYYIAASLEDLNAQVSISPYSIGYSTHNDATFFSNSYASMINRAGTVVSANTDTVSYAAMEKGGNLDGHLNSPLVDGISFQAWPMTGYNYFCIRLRSHVGTCDRRKAAALFMYDFYVSEIVHDATIQLGFAPVPDFIRDYILAKMVSDIKCTNGDFALAKYRVIETDLYSTYAFAPTLQVYMSSYKTLDAHIHWHLLPDYHSTGIMAAYKV